MIEWAKGWAITTAISRGRLPPCYYTRGVFYVLSCGWRSIVDKQPLCWLSRCVFDKDSRQFFLFWMPLKVQPSTPVYHT